MKRLVTSLLHVNGWVAVLIGSFIILDPISVLSSYGLQSDLSTGLLSELRAPGGLLLVCGLGIIFCATTPGYAHSGLLLSIMVYGGYASVRLLAILLDGVPPVEIQLAASIEVVLCGLSAFSLFKSEKMRNRKPAASAG